MKLQQILTPFKSDQQIVNEFLAQVESDSLLLSEGLLTEAGIKSLFANTANKLKSSLSKVKNPVEALNDLQGKVWVKLQMMGMGNDEKKKILHFAKKHAKLAKPALMIGIIGASLLGMDAAQASEIVNNLDQLPTDAVQQMVEPVADVANASGPSADDMSKFTNGFYNKMKALYDQGHNQVQYNGQTMSFDQLVKYAQQKTGVDAKEFIQYIGQQKDMDMNDATNEFFKWLQQRDAKGRSVFKDI